jgi:hypothetical protein
MRQRPMKTLLWIWTEAVTALAVMGIITFLCLV